MAENELSIRVRLDTGEAKAALQDVDARQRKATQKTQRIQTDLTNLERLEQRLFKKLGKIGLRSASAIAIGEVTTAFGIESTALGRIGSSFAQGLAFGSAPGAILNVSVSLITEAVNAIQKEKSEREEFKRFIQKQNQELREASRAQFDALRREKEDLDRKILSIFQEAQERASSQVYDLYQYFD